MQCGLFALERLAGTAIGTAYDRSQFDGALTELRRENYRRVLAGIGSQHSLRGCRLLDVGCSSGWFLGAARAEGCEAFGIEPDDFFWQRALRDLPEGVKVVCGEFPADLPADWGTFDVITFNDVFEHLPDPIAILAAAKQRLSPQGSLFLALPMADGFAFRVGGLLYRLGVTAALERMFQIHYPYPHLFYYAPRNLRALAQRAGFEVVRFERLRGFSFGGSLHRARMDQAQSVVGRFRQYLNALALLGFALVEPVLPADSGLAILRPRLT